MTDYAYPVIRWLYEVEAGEDAIRFQNPGGSSSIQTIAAGSYINRGSAGSPTDMLETLNAAMAAAATALGLTGTFTATLLPTGHVSIVRAGGASPADNLVINWTHATTTFPPPRLGFTTTASTVVTGTASVSPFQADCQWHPGRAPIFPGGEHRRGIDFEDRDLNGRPRLLSHHGTRWYERVLIWDAVMAARMLTSRAATASYATVAGVAEDEDNTWETMLEYLSGPEGPAGTNDVYLYDDNTPASATQSGPYYVVLSGCRPGLGGIETDAYDSGRGIEEYPVRILLGRSG